MDQGEEGQEVPISKHESNVSIICVDRNHDTTEYVSRIEKLTKVESFRILTTVRVTKYIIPMLINSYNLNKIEIFKAPVSNFLIFMIAKYCPKLNVLIIRRADFNPDLTDDGAQHIAALRFINHLDLSNSSISVRSMSKIIGFCRELKYFRADHCKYVTDDLLSFLEQLKDEPVRDMKISVKKTSVTRSALGRPVCLPEFLYV